MHARLNLEFGTATQKKSVRKMLLCRARASHSTCCTQWPPCFLGKGEHEPDDTASNALAPACPFYVCALDADHSAGGFCSLLAAAIAISLFQPRLPLCALSLCCALTDLRPPRLCAVEPALQLHRGALFSRQRLQLTAPADGSS